MHLHLTDYVLWIATPLIQMGVLIAMVRRGLHRDYPYFFNYTILQVVSVPVLYIIYTRSYPVFFYAYYVNIALSVLISFAVLQEIFKDAFRPYEALRDLSVILFRWSALVVLLVGVMVAINTNQAKSENGAIVDAILLAERSVRLMQCGLVFFLLLFSEYLGISRRSLLFGISLGFGFFAAINMLVATGMTHRGVLHQSTLRHINSEAYLVAVVIWLGYTLAAAPSESKVADVALRTKDWNSALEDARVQPGADSLLDTMDRTVERLLYPREESKINISTGHS
jgi:hypothetical protein